MADLLELLVKIKADNSDAVSKIDDTSSKAEKAGSGIGRAFATGAKVAGAALVAAGTAVGVLVTKSVQGYAQYEQLVGGVETLYGSSADKIMAYAEQAYQTAGMSSNQYMETATSFAAALVNSLEGDTDKAAEMADMAISDMADNVNKMGSSTEAVQNAYNGFAKGNFTMLDNLKLGYGGTKEEMERLLTKAEEIKASQGEVADYSIDSYADIVEAIHVVQDEMGITGTTSREASSTISGSLAMTKSAWENLVVGFSNDTADMDSLIQNVVTSAETAFNNLMPVIERALLGIADFVQKIAPIIAEKLPALVSQVLPPLISAATELIAGLVAALPALLQVLVDMAPTIISTIMDALIANLPMLVEAAVQLIATLANGISQSLPELIPAIVDLVVQIVTTLIENAPLLVEAGLQLIAGLIQGIVNAIPNLIQGIVQAAQALLDAILGFFGIHSPSTVMQDVGTNLIQGLINGITNMISAVKSAITNVCNTIKNVLSNAWNNIKSTASTAWNGIKSTVTNIASNLASTLSTKWESMKSRASSTWSAVKTNVSTAWSGIKSSISTAAASAYSTVSSKFESIRSAMSSKLESARSAVSNVISGIKGLFNFSWSLPHLALPHFSFSGRFSLNPPSVPHLSVSWYKKAMDNAYLLNGATIFGASGGKLLGGGEAGSEMVVGTDTLMNMINKASGNDITINVYASPNHDERRIAQEVEKILSANISRRRAAWA